MSDQLSFRDFERETRALDEQSEDRRLTIAELHKVHNNALDRLAERGHKLPLSDKLTQARIAVSAVMDLQGYGEVTEEAVKRAQQLFANLLAEQKAQPSATVHSS